MATRRTTSPLAPKRSSHESANDRDGTCAVRHIRQTVSKPARRRMSRAVCCAVGISLSGIPKVLYHRTVIAERASGFAWTVEGMMSTTHTPTVQAAIRKHTPPTETFVGRWSRSEEGNGWDGNGSLMPEQAKTAVSAVLRSDSGDREHHQCSDRPVDSRDCRISREGLDRACVDSSSPSRVRGMFDL